jgi:hypothetical protein
MGSAHTPSALRWAKRCVRQIGMVALLLPQTNGIEWMDVVAEPELCLRLFDHAYRHNNGRKWDECDSLAEPGAAPNCGPAASAPKSGVTNGPQSVT